MMGTGLAGILFATAACGGDDGDDGGGTSNGADPDNISEQGDPVEGGEITEASPNTDYDQHPRIVQAYAPLSDFDGFKPIVGAWIVGDACVGMGLREDKSRITQDLSRFKPHFIAD